MLCCFQPGSDPATSHDQQAPDRVSSFPGNRRYVQTEGNAVATGPPPPLQKLNQQHTPSSSMSQFVQLPPMAAASRRQEEKAEGELVSVTVPAGVVAGQILHIMHPDGSGRKISAQIPDGISAGDVFYIRAPPRRSSTPLTSPSGLIEPPSGFSTTPEAKQQQQQQTSSSSSVPMAHAQLSGPSSDASPAVEPGPTPFSQCLDSPSETITTHRHESYHQSKFTTPPIQSNIVSNTSLLKVTVPPGTLPGSIIHVQVPRENRRIAAQVPPDCTEFHVQYEPAPAQYCPIQSQTYPPCHGKKLLKVQVPPGMNPGDALHVRIPDEPDRLIKAVVPPGKVHAFNVEYEPHQ